jgi:hypothetical protein
VRRRWLFSAVALTLQLQFTLEQIPFQRFLFFPDLTF